MIERNELHVLRARRSCWRYVQTTGCRRVLGTRITRQLWKRLKRNHKELFFGVALLNNRFRLGVELFGSSNDNDDAVARWSYHREYLFFFRRYHWRQLVNRSREIDLIGKSRICIRKALRRPKSGTLLAGHVINRSRGAFRRRARARKLWGSTKRLPLTTADDCFPPCDWADRRRIIPRCGVQNARTASGHSELSELWF